MTNGTVSVTNTTSIIAGGLQVCVNKRWGTVCHGQWGPDDAAVACRQLGLSYISEWQEYTNIYVLDNSSCNCVICPHTCTHNYEETREYQCKDEQGNLRTSRSNYLCTLRLASNSLSN